MFPNNIDDILSRERHWAMLYEIVGLAQCRITGPTSSVGL